MQSGLATYALTRRISPSTPSLKFIDRLIGNVVKDAEEYSSDVVIGVREGGLYVATRLSEILQIPLDFIRMSYSRPGFSNFKRMPLVDLVANHILLPVLSQLPVAYSSPVLYSVPRTNLRDKKVLLADDDSISGRTLDFGRAILGCYHPKEIRTAVLFSDNGRADYTAMHEGVGFEPWAVSSPHFPEYQAWKASHNL